MGDVAAPWTDGVEITDYTHTDLEASRTKTSKVSDPDGELHVFVETLHQYDELATVSETLDRALRVELAAVLDSGDVLFERDQYDVAYTIPPRGWLAEQTFEIVDLVAEGEVDTEERVISFSMPPVVYEMAQDVLDEGVYVSFTELVGAGVRRLLGR